jgi:hypothetical protein
MPIRYHLDEHVDPAVGHGLRQRGIDVTTTVDTALSSRSDTDQLAFALAESRVLVTHDQDFLRLHAAGVNHTGIAYCHQRARTIGEIVQRLELIYHCVSADEMRGRVEFL